MVENNYLDFLRFKIRDQLNDQLWFPIINQIKNQVNEKIIDQVENRMGGYKIPRHIKYQIWDYLTDKVDGKKTSE